MLRRLLFSLLRILFLFVVLGLGYLFFFQHRFIYFPRPLVPAEIAEFVAGGGRPLTFQTSQGTQTAWLQPAAGGLPAERLWIVCAGNASRALDLAFLPDVSELTRDAFLFLDYPGYGNNPGTPHPDTISENLAKAVPLAAAAVGIPVAELPGKGLVFGHSLGAAVALLGAEAWGIRRGVFLTPFTSTMEMSQVVVGLPLGWLVKHRFDNRARLQSLEKREGRAWIFHGSEDEAIPVAMSRALAKEFPGTVIYNEISDGNHNELLDIAGPAIWQAMREAREQPPR